MKGRPTDLYRFWDTRDRLLYVGISYRIENRLSEHRRTKPWEEVAKVTIEHYPDRTTAEAAERHAIQTEHPKWNIAHAIDVSRAEDDIFDDALTHGDYLRYLMWPEIPKMFSDACDNCFVAGDFPISALALRRNRQWVDVIYQCSECAARWKCHFTLAFLSMAGVADAVAETFIKAFPSSQDWWKRTEDGAVPELMVA